MRRISLRGVLIGGVVDIGASFVTAIIGAMLVLIISAVAHIPRTSIHQSGLVTDALFVCGLINSAIGGYIAAKISKHDEVLNGALSSGLCVFLTILELCRGHKNAWPALVLAPMFAALGGYLNARRRPQVQDSSVH